MQIKLKNVRIAFCQNLFEAGSIDVNSKPAFSATFILQKDDPQNSAIVEVIKTVAQSQWKTNWEKELKAINAAGKLCYRDGDTKAQYDGFEGNMYISARSYVAPKVFNKDRSLLTAKDGLPYAGCYVNALVDIWAQDNNFGKRINCALTGIQFCADGDAFSGSRPATENDFDDLSNAGDDMKDLLGM